MLLEPKLDLRRALQELLSAEGYTVEACGSLEELIERHTAAHSDLALAAWQSLDGLLADEHRHDLAQLTNRIPMVIMVPRVWLRVLQPLDLAVRGLLAKPFDADELLACVAGSIQSPEPTQAAALHAGSSTA
ncbi:MAG: response regulator transcription factor [Chloroflexi bacterium]|nr:response regulator transcription factor [Chloroflexota bacterium]